MRRPRLKTILAIGGIVLAFAPLLAAQIAISWQVHSQAEATVAELSSQMVARAEAAIDAGLDTLAALARAKVSDCSPAALNTMRRAVYGNYFLKEVGVTGEDGRRIVCNHIGDRFDVAALSSTFSARSGSVTLQIARLGNTGSDGLMMIWGFGDGSGLSAVLPPEVVVPDILPAKLREAGVAMTTLTDGTLVGAVPAPGSGSPNARFDANAVRGTARSERYPLGVALYLPLSVFQEEMATLRMLGHAGGVAIAAVIIGLVAYGFGRPPSAAAEMREAIERGEFIPYYQPVVNISTGRLMGCEVLMRRRMPDGSIVPPSAFIALAESTGLALPMTRRLMEQVRDDLNTVYGARPHLSLSINLFDDHFESLRIIRDIETIFGGSRIAFRQIALEITERQPLANIDRARVVIRRLQELGARVALDDAGTGHGGLAYLQQLGIDVIKIDKLFIDTIDADDSPSPILDSLIKLGQELGKELVAEGVEAMEQIAYLRSRGVCAAQGFLFAPPLPARAFVELAVAMEPVDAAPEAGRAEAPEARVA
jgi:sensor c-di-GMP phosphodiesterase-like protein